MLTVYALFAGGGVLDRVLGIGEYFIAEGISDVLKIYALSACVALTAYSPIKKILGMVHIALPNSEIMQNRIIANPSYYADTAVPLIINRLCLGFGCTKGELEIRLFGGAQPACENDTLNIGMRNTEMVESVLGRMNLRICYSDTGGNMARSIAADVATGAVKVVYQPLSI